MRDLPIEPPWQIWIDTGGTFTDGLALTPEGKLRRAKVLSSSALRGRLETQDSPRSLSFSARWQAPDGFATGAGLFFLERDDSSLITDSHQEGRLETAASLPQGLLPGEPFEIRFEEEPPILAARLLTETRANQALPRVAMRLATTRGTNALLERRGARLVLLITRGFADLLLIGDQRRDDLFALDASKPLALFDSVLEVPERLDAEGRVLEALDLEALRPQLAALAEEGYESAAVALLHSYRNSSHERQLSRELQRVGIHHVAQSAALAPTIKILPRAETAVVDAYLAPIIENYLSRVKSALTARPFDPPTSSDESRDARLHVMTSAGGLVAADHYRAKDSLLSGPAGGVVGAAATGRECGFERLIAFDMGGTSTDVSRFDGDYEYVFEHRVGSASVAGPALAIETVAAGGGSICHREGKQLKVGPQSAGAHPGPACYGAGGPLTLTDVNLLLGRLDPSRFGIPIQPDAAEAAAIELLGKAQPELLAGFLTIANERMAEAIRRISVRRGYDPRQYALVAFGGAGGQHACAVAGLLGITRVIAPREAGLLSALGLGAAVIERFAHLQVLAPLERVRNELEARLAVLADQASREVSAEGVEAEEVAVRRRLAFLRFSGQETPLELEVSSTGTVAGQPLAAAFLERYQDIYGYRPSEREIELDSLRVIASSRHRSKATPQRESNAAEGADPPTRDAVADGQRRTYVGDGWRNVSVFHGANLRPGDRLFGPALVLDDHATLVVDQGWNASMSASRALVLCQRASS